MIVVRKKWVPHTRHINKMWGRLVENWGNSAEFFQYLFLLALLLSSNG